MKKLLLSLVALLTTVGAWAQNYDGIYTMQVDENQQRGYVVAGDGYADYPVLSEITYTGCEGNSIEPIANGKNWYITTINDGATYYFYNVAVGKFLVQEENKVNFGTDPYEWKISANGTFFNIEDAENAGKFLSGGCSRSAANRPMAFDGNKDDGGAKYTITSVDGGTTTFATQIAAADEAILQGLIDLAKTYESGTNIGDYTEESINALKEAIDEVQAKIDADNVTDGDAEALQAVIDALEIVLPDAEKFYVLRCNHQDRYIYVNSANKLQWTGDPYGNASNYVWKFVAGSARNTVKMMSVHTQSYLNTVSNNQQATFGEGVDVTIKKASGVDGAYVFEAGNAGIGLHAHGANNTVIGYTNTAGANPYFFEEVEEFSHTLSVGENGWASLVLGFNATIPANVEVYTVSEATKTKAELEPVTGVIPANEAVLVKATEDNYTFSYTKAEGSVTSNLLEGSLFNKNVDVAAYVLAEIDGNVGFYSATLTDGAFQNNANKAYLPATAVPAGARFLSFDFGTETAIESIEGENGNVKAEIYDLAGRRVQNAQKGLYIVNGKKVIK